MDGGNQARPDPEVHNTDTGALARPDPAVTASDEFTVAGPGGRRAQSPLLDSQRATMYRALYPSAEENADMDISTP
eukprot:4549466-Amphidinium_carterae.1